MTERIRKTKSKVRPKSKESPPIPFDPKRIATTPIIKNAMAALNIIDSFD
jgi:hypothetical protein